MRGQRQLDQDAVHGGVVVQAVHDGEQVGLAGCGRQADGAGGDAGLGCGAVLAADVDVAGGIVADQDHDEGWLVR